MSSTADTAAGAAERHRRPHEGARHHGAGQHATEGSDRGQASIVAKATYRGRRSGVVPAAFPTIDGMLVVAFDLDMTLVDTAPGVASTLTVLAEELGVEIPVDDVAAHIGPSAARAARALRAG